MLAILASILSPIATKLIDAYITPKLMPVIEEVKKLEHENLTRLKTHSNDIKHDKILRLIINTPSIWKFVNKCGWNAYELDVVVKFCVLMAKKPPTVKENRDKWNDDDMNIVFDFARVIIGKWVKSFSKKR